MRSRDKWQLLKLPYHNAMVTKFAHLQKTYEKLQTLKLDNLMLLTWQINKIISHFRKTYDH